MISAIIICRANSSRFPKKHLSLIGTKFLLEIILDNLKSYKNINEIFIGTGSKKTNKIYFNKIKKIKKFKDVKFHFKNDEKDVTGRINEICKKISNKYTLVISGDCPLIDISLIKRLFAQLKKNKNANFIRSKKSIIHEGIKLFKTDAWDKVNKLSKKKMRKSTQVILLEKKRKNLRLFIISPKDMKLKNYADFQLILSLICFSFKKFLKL